VLAADGEVPNQAILDNFDSLEFLAVFSPFAPNGALGQKADVMLPCPAWMEQDGTYTSHDGRLVRHKEKILTPLDSVMDTTAALDLLAQKAEIALEYHSPADWRREARMQIAGK
jgi:predicted molibdopterin-dependent oxidoreductase YjgC